MRSHRQSVWSSLARSLRSTPDDPTPVSWPLTIIAFGGFVIALVLITWAALALLGGNS